MPAFDEALKQFVAAVRTDDASTARLRQAIK
jgi:hypothetical protein